MPSSAYSRSSAPRPALRGRPPAPGRRPLLLPRCNALDDVSGLLAPRPAQLQVRALLPRVVVVLVRLQGFGEVRRVVAVVVDGELSQLLQRAGKAARFQRLLDGEKQGQANQFAGFAVARDGGGEQLRTRAYRVKDLF